MKLRLLVAIAVMVFGMQRWLPAQSAGSAQTLDPVVAVSDGWLNGRVSARDIKNKVVLLDVFTFACYNCQNVAKNLRMLHHRSSDLVIIGVHSPETSYEKSRENVIDNLRSQSIVWPVVLDNSFAIWNAYAVGAWPTQLLFDRTGRLRKTIVGDSQDEAVNATIQELLAEK